MLLVFVSFLSLAAGLSSVDSSSPKQRFYEAFFVEVAERKYQEALSEYRDLVDAFPADPDFAAWVRVRVAACEKSLGKYEAASEQLRLASGIEGVSTRVRNEIEKVRRSLDRVKPIEPSVDVDSGSASEKSAVVEAIERGLSYLAKEQLEDGRWTSPAVAHDRSKLGELISGYDVGVTGLVLGAFVASGQSHQGKHHPADSAGKRELAANPGEQGSHAKVVQKGLEWLLAQQKFMGSEIGGHFGLSEIPTSVYNHAVAVVTLADLLELTGDGDRLGEPLSFAVRHTMYRQNPGYGWQYQPRSGKNDTSVTTWMMLGLQRARALSSPGNLAWDDEEVRQSLDGGHGWIARTTSKATSITGYVAPGDPGSRWLGHGSPYPFLKMPTMTAAALAVRMLRGEEDATSPIVSRQVRVLLDQPPRWQYEKGRSTVNYLYWYWGSLAFREIGGTSAAQWRDAVYEALVRNQARDGAWLPVGEWGKAGGPNYSTALAVRTLAIWAQRPQSAADSSRR